MEQRPPLSLFECAEEKISRASEGRMEAVALSVVSKARDLFAGFESAPALLLAVSGGPDSIALMLLAARWAAQAGPLGPKLYVATVDHALRPEARAEAEGVAAAAAKLNLPHKILTWTGSKPKTRIQERAREARYALLGAYAREIGASHLLTGHHAGDQAETILFRLGRGSGPGGLAGMKRESLIAPGLILARPLLGLTKAQLTAICQEAGHAFVDDPSNHDLSFARVRLRAAQDSALRLGLDAPTLTRLATRLARAEEALEAEASRCLGLASATWEPGRFTAKLTPLRETKLEIWIRLLRQALDGLNPGGGPIRLERLETLAENLNAALQTNSILRATLHGTCITLGRDTILTIVPEPQRRRGRGPNSGLESHQDPKIS